MRIKATNETKTEKPIQQTHTLTYTHTHVHKHGYTERQRQSRDACEAVAFCCIATKSLEQRVCLGPPDEIHGVHDNNNSSYVFYMKIKKPNNNNNNNKNSSAQAHTPPRTHSPRSCRHILVRLRKK